MIEIGDKIVSLDILTEGFACDLSRCNGACCVEGNAGAPMEDDEADILEEEYEAYKPYMKPAGVEVVEKNGFMVVDADGEYTTPLINGAECAYAYYESGTTFCAIEKAWKEGRTRFRKPISCHLYPIRVARFSNGSYGLNYHRWDVCCPAGELGRKIGMPVYKAVKDALVRRFGEDFYEELELAAAYLQEMEG